MIINNAPRHNAVLSNVGEIGEFRIRILGTTVPARLNNFRKFTDMANSKAKVFLSRRNLVTLLAKLDGIKQGTPSACTLIKFKAGSPEEFKQTMVEIAVTAVEDDVYYTERSPGAVREDYIDALTKKVDH